MAYVGNNLILRSATISGSPVNSSSGTVYTGTKEWVYVTSDSIGTVNGNGYFSDAVKRGVQQGDIVWVLVGSAGPVGPWTPHLCYFSTVPYTANGVDATSGFVTTGS